MQKKSKLIFLAIIIGLSGFFYLLRWNHSEQIKTEFVKITEFESKEEEVSYVVQESSALQNDISDADDKININNASKAQLMTLKGIGESKADAIIQYRDNNGGFSNIEDIMNIPGIKQATFEKIRDYICV